MTHALLAAAGSIIAPGNATAQARSPAPLAGMAAVSFLEGKWIGEVTGPQAFKVEITFFRGPTNRVLHFHTYSVSAEKRDLLYEGYLHVAPDSVTGHQVNIKPDGTREVSTVALLESGFMVMAPKTRSFVRPAGADRFVWDLQVPDGSGGWTPLWKVEYVRMTSAPARSWGSRARRRSGDRPP